MSSLSDLRWQFDRRLTRLVESKAVAQHWQQAWIEQATQEYRQDTESAIQQHEQQLHDVRERYSQAISEMGQRALALQKAGGIAWAGWDDPVWKSWRPKVVPLSGVTDQTIADSVRIGRLRVRGPWHELKLTAIVPLLGSRHLFFRVPAEVREACCIGIQATVLRLLATAHPGQVRLHIVDSGELVSLWTPFLRLGNFDPAMVGGKVLTHPDEVAQRIIELAEQMERRAGPMAEDDDLTADVMTADSEPLTLMVVTGFPPSLTEETLKAFSRIVALGARNGISVIAMFAAEQSFPISLSPAELEAAAELLIWDGAHFIWQRDLARAGTVDLDPLPEPALRDRILDEVAKVAADVFRSGIAFDSLAPGMSGWASTAADHGLLAVIGAGSGGYIQDMRFGDGAAQHALVVGGSERARTSLLNVVITSLASSRSPNDLRLYLVSLRRTSGFEAYAACKLPQARVVAVGCEREYALSVLQEVARLAAIRAQLAAPDGSTASEVEPGPRHLVVLDDLEQLLLPGDEIADQAGEALRTFAALGPKGDVHLVLACESLSSISARAPVLGPSWARLVLPCAEAEAALVLAADATAVIARLGGGDVLFNDTGGLSYGSHRVRVPTLSEEARRHRLRSIAKSVEDHSDLKPAPLTFYDPTLAPELGNNVQAVQLLSAAPSQGAADVLNPTVWLGEPPIFANPVVASFARQSANNLLVITQDRARATGMLAAAAMVLAPQAAAVIFLQLDRLAGPDAETLSRIARLFPEVLRLVEPDDVPSVLAEQLAASRNRMSLAYALSAQRQGQAHDERPTFLLLYGLQMLASDDAGVVSAAEQTLDSVTDLLREGPDVGVHALAWCDRLFSLNSALGWQALRHFSMRAVGQLVAEDSEVLIEAPYAEKLTSNQMLLFDKRDGHCERFKPYAMPSIAGIDEVERWLAVRVGC